MGFMASFIRKYLMEKQKFSLGDTVRIKSTGEIGRIQGTGRAILNCRKWKYWLDIDEARDFNSLDERHLIDDWYAEELELIK